MFFKKKKETDVDVLQKIKDRIAEDNAKKQSSTQNNTQNILDNLVETDNEEIAEEKKR